MRKLSNSKASPLTRREVLAMAPGPSLAERALARIENAAESARKANGHDTSVQIIASAGHVNALIKTPGLTVQFSDGQVAVDIRDNEAEQSHGL